VTLFIGSIPGILVAFVLALVNLAKRAANPAIDVLAGSGEPTESLLDEAPTGSVTAPGVVVVRLAAPLFFANGSVFADAVKRAVTAAPAASVQHVVIDMEAVTDVDVTGAEAFESLLAWLDARGITLGFSRVRPDARARLVDLGLLGDRRVYDTNRAAIAALEK
jgi:MFS superfamily sulfate permease-like transporter